MAKSCSTELGIEVDHVTVYRAASLWTPYKPRQLITRPTYRRAVCNGLSNNSSALGASGASMT